MARRYAELPIPAPSQAPPHAGRAGGAHAIFVALALGCTLVPLAKGLGSRTELIAPTNPDVQMLAIFAGTFAGACLVGAVAMRLLDRGANGERPGLRGLPDALAAAGLCVLAATWCARMLVEAYAFTGLAPASFPVTFAVVGRDSGRHGDRFVRVRFGPAGREFSVPASWAAYDAAHPGETVTLPVETGRGGIQRARLPLRGLAPADLHGD